MYLVPVSSVYSHQDWKQEECYYSVSLKWNGNSMPLYVNTYSHRNGMEALYLLLVLAIPAKCGVCGTIQTIADGFW